MFTSVFKQLSENTCYSTSLKKKSILKRIGLERQSALSEHLFDIDLFYIGHHEEVLLRVKEQRNILHEIHKRKANWIGHILRRNCLLQRVIEGKIQGEIEVTGRQGRRRRKLFDDFKERRGYSHLKEKALDRTMWRAGFGRGGQWEDRKQ